MVDARDAAAKGQGKYQKRAQRGVEAKQALASHGLARGFGVGIVAAQMSDIAQAKP